MTLLMLASATACLTISLLAISSVFVLKYSYGNPPPEPPASLRQLRTLITLISFVLFVTLFFRGLDADLFHVKNVAGLCAALFILQGLRAVLDYLESKAAGFAHFGRAAATKNLTDFFGNVVIFLGIYLAIMYGPGATFANYIFRVTGYTLCAFNLFKVLKFRLYDDLYLRTLEKGGSYTGPPAKPGVTLLQGLFNVLLRSYFLVAVSFGFIYSIMVQNDLGTKSAQLLFSAKPDNLSQDVFVDLLYFSVITISTVGYGDISPVAPVAKLLCMMEIMLGYFFIGALLALITGNYGSAKTKPDD